MSTQLEVALDPRSWDLVDRLHKSLRIAGLKPHQMTTQLHVHRNTMSKWLDGSRIPNRRTLVAWVRECNHPDITIEWLEGDYTPPDLPIHDSRWNLASRRAAGLRRTGPGKTHPRRGGPR